jgi:hypothetical protein
MFDVPLREEPKAGDATLLWWPEQRRQRVAMMRMELCIVGVNQRIRETSGRSWRTRSSLRCLRACRRGRRWPNVDAAVDVCGGRGWGRWARLARSRAPPFDSFCRNGFGNEAETKEASAELGESHISGDSRRSSLGFWVLWRKTRGREMSGVLGLLGAVVGYL